jgi:site-specific recombinase XerD
VSDLHHLIPDFLKMKKSVKIYLSSSKEKEIGHMRSSPAWRSTKIKHLSVSEVRRFFRAIPQEKLRDRLLFDLIYHYGLRRTEACLIHLDDFDFKANTFEVHRVKHGVSHPYPLFPGTKRLLTAYLDQPRQHWTNNLFPSRQRLGEPISASNVAFLFRHYAREASLPDDRSHVHVLRHSVAMHMAEGGLDGMDVMDWLGHVAYSSTQVYMHVSARRRSKSLKRMLSSGEIA